MSLTLNYFDDSKPSIEKLTFLNKLTVHTDHGVWTEISGKLRNFILKSECCYAVCSDNSIKTRVPKMLSDNVIRTAKYKPK